MHSSIIDLIIRIKNGYLAHNESVESPYSRFREEILKKLEILKFIKGYTVKSDKIKHMIVDLLYVDGTPVLTDVKVVSKPGQRIYSSGKNLKPVVSGFGYSILTTSKGILTNNEAKKQKIGGELLFMIW